MKVLVAEKIGDSGVDLLREFFDVDLGVGWSRDELGQRIAGYEGILRDAESRINWANHVDIIYNLIRGCDPAPGAWTTMDGKKLFVFNAAKRIARTFSEVKGKKLGEAATIGGKLVVHGQGGFIEIERVRLDGGRKVAASEVGIEAGTILGG